jgi:cell fate (sporulation/competence/biofilm development) regulator YlbF (YheA/YmcA/DUF963 family)
MSSEFSPRLLDATQPLIENLLASKAFISYRRASARLNADAAVQAQLRELSRVQARLRQKQANNGVTKADLDTLRVLQESIQGNAIFIEYSKAQKDAVRLLQEVNTEISQLIGIDFAALANRQTC